MKNKEAFLSGFLSVIKKYKRALFVALLVFVGVLLIFSGMGTQNGSSAVRDEVEEKLSEMCSSLSGVGECRVMVTYKESEKRYGSSGVKTVESVAVVCKGADRAGVRAELTEMLSSLFGIGTNRIHISKMR